MPIWRWVLASTLCGQRIDAFDQFDAKSKLVSNAKSDSRYQLGVSNIPHLDVNSYLTRQRYCQHPRDPSLRAHMRSHFVQDDKEFQSNAKN